VSGGSSVGPSGFCGPCGGYIPFVVEDDCVRDCRVLWICKIGIVVLSVGNECEGGRGRLVTGWGRIEREGKGKRRE
jgi:hypothetical protein